MKGISLTLTVIVVAIALLVTVLVVVTIFGGQMASFLAVLNPWSSGIAGQSLCNQKCAAWCSGHSGSSDTGWATVGTVNVQGEQQPCSTIMSGISDKCDCGMGGTTGVTCTVDVLNKCSSVTNADKYVDVDQSKCSSGKCKVYCDAIDKVTGICAA